MSLLVLSLACSSPVRRFERIAGDLGLERSEVRGAEFTHRAYFNRRARPWRTLHVYLEGDGLPWRTPTVIAADPTPRTPFVLGLMGQDEAPAVYLGRPCYHSPAADPGHPGLWTHGRYSERIVDSLEAAVRKILEAEGVEDLAILGYSGGGVLAMLLAERLEATRAVVTVAANLDVDAWADHRGFTRLHGSLNPARRPPLSAVTRQLHLVGGRDRTVPRAVVEPTVRRQDGAEMWIEPEFDHRCCWREIWPRVLEWVARP